MPLVSRDLIALTAGIDLTTKFTLSGSASVANDGNGLPRLVVASGYARWQYSATNTTAEPGLKFGLYGSDRVYVRWRDNPTPGPNNDAAEFYINLVGLCRISLYDRNVGGNSPVGLVSSPAPDQSVNSTTLYSYEVWIEGTGASTVFKMKIWNPTTSSYLTWSGASTWSYNNADSATVAGHTQFVADVGGFYNDRSGYVVYLEQGSEILPADDSTTITRTVGTTSATLAIASTATNTPLTYVWDVAGSNMPAGAKSAATGAATSTLVVPSGLVAGQVYTVALTITDTNSNTLARTVSFTTRRVALPATLPKFGVVGNSITVGGSPNWLEGAAAIVSRVLKTPSSIDTYRYSSSGSSSTTIATGASATAADFAAQGVTDVFVGPLATNDVGAAADTFANTTTLVNAMIAAIPTVRIWLMPDVAKTGGPFWYQGGDASEIPRMRAYLALCAAADNGSQIRYIGDLIYDACAIEGISLGDGTHPTSQGYDDMGQIVAAEWMRQMGYALPASSSGGGGGSAGGDEDMEMVDDEVTITPTDGEDITASCPLSQQKGFYTDSDATLAVKTAKGTDRTVKTKAGLVKRLRVREIQDAGTDATAVYVRVGES